ncbi:LuxR C-terminal-related transcriptional regulator [Pseudonocardia halophobica]|uniref:LuxR C-terminal-related transcriptional regulator n=1 Tax=Pseudonocardia halophobica TaxID=29401 RepID=UPI003D8BB638
MTASAVLVVDDHALLSASLAVALRDRGLSAEALRPDDMIARLHDPAPPGGLVLLDLDLGGETDGAKLVSPLRRSGWRVLVVTGSVDEGRIATAVAAGAAGWMPKTALFEELVDAATRVVAGRNLVDPAERRRLEELAAASGESRELERRRWERLTPREREIVGHIAAGMRPKAIAEECVVSVATVRTQIKSILGKLEVNSQLEVAAFARRLTAS